MSHVQFIRSQDVMQVIIRDSSFNKIFDRTVNTTNKKDLENLLEDLKHKGVDLIAIIKNKMINGDDWFS